MPFNQDDFKNPEVLQQLQVIILSEIGKNPLGSYRNLSAGEKKKYNKSLNTYINALPEEWKPKIQNDFNTICIDDIFTPKFRPENHLFGCDIDTDIKELRTEEQLEKVEV
jgi:hypothetical protein